MTMSLSLSFRSAQPCFAASTPKWGIDPQTGILTINRIELLGANGNCYGTLEVQGIRPQLALCNSQGKEVVHMAAGVDDSGFLIMSDHNGVTRDGTHVSLRGKSGDLYGLITVKNASNNASVKVDLDPQKGGFVEIAKPGGKPARKIFALG